MTAGACVTLAGCMGNPFATAPVDPRSPIAAEVAMTARANRDFPSFAEIPPMPADVRPVGAFGAAAADASSARDRLASETAPGTWSLGGTDAFAARAQTQAGRGVVPPGGDANTEAFAREAQKRATPPPSPN